MTTDFLYERRVAFADTDMAGVAHFTAILRWVEEAESAWHRARGSSLAKVEAGAVTGWPKVSVRAEYRSPVCFDDMVRVVLSGPDYGSSSAIWRFRVEKSDSAKLVAEGELRVIHARISATGEISGLPVG